MEFHDLLIRVLNGSTDNTIGLTNSIKESEVQNLLAKLRECFLSQPPMIEIDAPVVICGDIHGQFCDLLRLFQNGGYPPTSNYLFLGDYVDRGRYNLEVIIILYLYKIRFPKSMFLLRGNHECSNVNKAYGFMDECQRRFGSVKLWQSFQDTFATMPLSGVVGSRILCMHGGLSPKLSTLDQLRKIARPVDPTGDCIEMDLLWADPVAGLAGFQEGKRGASYGFGADAITKFLQTNDLDMMARAHQVVQDGYEFFANRKCLTIFSAPHYCGQFENSAAIMIVDSNLQCSFRVFRPTYSKTGNRVLPTSQFDRYEK